MKFRVMRDDYPGTDMETGELYKFALREDKQVYKIEEYAEISVTILSNTDYASGTHIHGLGFVPTVRSTVKYGTKGYPYMGVLMPFVEVPAYGGGTTTIFFNVTWDNNQILFEVAADIFGNPANNETFVLECYIMNNQI